ncbi:hypothetical protein ACFQZI_12680 [Mucilaginibacter lutimaris]|uniref:Uncharacterized protein n=1 Tax=Mucilaginibacter lutimaris TaxID=931629 RepID=A0ABW2ZHL4_9SPHI
MKRINKQFPIAVLHELRDFEKTKKAPNNLFYLDDSGDHLFKAVDQEKTSDFYFRISNYSEKHGYHVTMKPGSVNDVESRSFYLKAESLDNFFKVWYNCLEEYAKFEEEDKDPFLKNLEDQFLDGLNLNDENKNEPLSVKQIFLLEENLSQIINEIRNYETEENSEQIAEIIEDAANLRSDLGNQTKEWIAKKFSTILAKITKEGPEILKGIFKEVGKQFLTQGVKYLFEHGDKLIL